MATASRRGKAKIKTPKKYGSDFSAEWTWEQLTNNIREIQNHNSSNLSFEEIHRHAYNMVLYKHGETLYKGVNQLVAENLNKLAEEKIIPTFPTGGVDDPMQKSHEGELLLKALKSVWDDHINCMTKLGQVLRYMDRVYTKNAGVLEILPKGLELFLKHIIRPPIKDHVITAILNQVEVEREGYVINRSAVKGCVDVLLSLKTNSGAEVSTVYKSVLEPALLRESELFYKAEGERLLNDCRTPEFLRRVESRFESEDSRTHHYLATISAAPLNQILKDNLLTPHLSTMISMHSSGLDSMIDSDKREDLSRLYRLVIKVPVGLPCLKRALKDSIARRGKEINDTSIGTDVINVEDEQQAPESGKRKDLAKPRPQNRLQPAIKWVEDVLALKNKLDDTWQQAFQKDREVESSLNEAFETFINQNDRSSEFISLFIDDNLKNGLKGKTDAEVENVLDKTITIFRFITEKDVFERYYKGHLAKRLLSNRSVSNDAERGMLAKLKVECGFQFTQKLEVMFHDIKLSEDTMESYHAHLAKTTAQLIDLNVIIMASGFWPITPPSFKCTMPAILEKSCKSFEQFYLARHTGRCLTWQTTLGNAHVRVTFRARKHDLNVSTLALVILLLFENLQDDEFLTYSEIKDATSIEEEELKRQLQSLACAKFKVLKKHPPGRDIHDDDSFSFNNDFTSNMQKIKISTISSRVETNEERKETFGRVEEQRKLQTEACIVRIMKDRKHMSHNELVNEVTRQLASRFHPEATVIKKRIEHLIEGEYLERCEDRTSYNYLA